MIEIVITIVIGMFEYIFISPSAYRGTATRVIESIQSALPHAIYQCPSILVCNLYCPRALQIRSFF